MFPEFEQWTPKNTKFSKYGIRVRKAQPPTGLCSLETLENLEENLNAANRSHIILGVLLIRRKKEPAK